MKEFAEQLTEQIVEVAKVYAIYQFMLEKFIATNVVNEVTQVEKIVAKQEEVVSLLQSCVQRAVAASKYKEEHDFLAILISDHTSYFLEVSYWTDLLEEENKTLHGYKAKLCVAQDVKSVLYTVQPPVMSTVFVVGITGNGLLLTIFIRHKETMTFPNSMLMNLTAVDCLTLLINVLLDFFRLRSAWQLGVPISKLFYLSSYMFIAVSIYSVVTLSVQRFMAVRHLPSGAMCHVGRKTKYVFVATVWAFAFVLSLPHALIADSGGLCKEDSFENFGLLSTADLVLFCIVPAILVAVFSGLTAAGIRRSAGSIPGEGAGQERLRHRLIVSSAVLTALAAHFVVSYTPVFLYRFLYF
jgi:gastrin-releasing peptide receptor